MINIILKDHIGIIKFNSSRMNGLNMRFLNNLLNKLIEIELKSEIRLVVITSELPSGFSSGLDIRNLYDEDSHNQTSKNIIEIVKMVYKINKFILTSKKIYIAALSGAVIGSAVSIALSCDFRIADKSTWIWLPDPQFGGLLADGGIELLKHLIGISRAKILLLTNDRVNANKAFEFGLLYCITSKKDLMETVLNFANRISDYDFHTLFTTKEIINSDLLKNFQEEKLKRIVYSEGMYKRLKSYLI